MQTLEALTRDARALARGDMTAPEAEVARQIDLLPGLLQRLGDRLHLGGIAGGGEGTAQGHRRVSCLATRRQRLGAGDARRRH